MSFSAVDAYGIPYDYLGRPVDPNTEDSSLDLDMEAPSVDSDAVGSLQYAQLNQHPQNHQLHYVAQSSQHHAHTTSHHHYYAQPTHGQQHHADPWFDHQQDAETSLPDLPDQWAYPMYQQPTALPLHIGKRSASDAGFVEEFNPKRVKTESSPAVNSEIVAAYQQLLLIQLQQVQALMGNNSGAGSTPVSPSGLSSSASSVPASPIKQEPVSPLFPSPPSPTDSLPAPVYVPPQRERRVRPKVVPEKGGVQCQGFNRKKNIRCRNAALMEFMGPRPMYCAEHIHLDPTCLYTKCRSSFHSSPDDGKGCREVVLKEFGFCHKHFDQFLSPLSGAEGVHQATDCLNRVEDCLYRLSVEAQAAKKVDPDLFQRKHKLIPKFVQMKNCLTRHLTAVSALPASVSCLEGFVLAAAPLPSHMASM